MYNWIETTFNVSGGITQVIAVIVALAAVLLLFGLFVFVLKRLTGANVTHSRNRQPRLAVMESSTVDTRRRLILIRRDNVEHLILVGGPSDVVVEQNIVRNAPLAVSRPAMPQASSYAGAPMIKAPMAPGPDIPARPDDNIDPPAPKPTEAVPPPAPEPQKTPVSKTPVTSQHGSDAISPQGSSGFPRPQQQAGKPSKTESESEPSSSQGRAAELLRTATQNGFNRTVTSSAGPEVVPPAKAKEQTGTSVRTADVKPETTAPGSTATTAKPADKIDVSAATASAAPRPPFNPRERPTYGGHSISPPASGPAARAKTAFIKPVEQPASDKRGEPVLGTTAPKPGDAASEEGKAPQKTVSEDQVTEHVAAKEPTGPKEADTETPPLSEAPSKTSAEDLLKRLADFKKKSGQIRQKDASPPDSGQTASAEAPQNEERPNPNLSEMSDAPDIDALQEGSPEEKESGGVMQNQARDQKPKPSEPTSKSMSEKNPIEEEMAKILDELSGQPN